MGVFAGPEIVEDGLVFSIDVANRKCISPLGCTGFNNAPQLVKNLVSTSDTINSYNGVKLGNLSYYTIFSIDYPESSYGGDAASRDGITPGYDVRSGTKTFDFGRALHYAVYDNPTQSWVKTSRYDSYVGTAAVDTFVSEYATAVAAYPDAVHIVAGSHRDSYHTSAQYEILRDLGAPSNVNSIIGFSSPEWILVGKPGLGAGNAYGWAFQNYSTDPTRVAHLNMGLPIYGGTDNYLEFDGAYDYIDLGANTQLQSIGSNATIECWFKSTDVGSSRYGILVGWGDGNSYYSNFGIGNWGSFSSSESIYLGYNSDVQCYVNETSSTYHDGNWHHAVVTIGSNNHKIFVDGVQKSLVFYRSNSYSVSNVFGYSAGTTVNIGRRPYGGGSGYFQGHIPIVKIYDRILSTEEIQQNFNANRSRFGI